MIMNILDDRLFLLSDYGTAVPVSALDIKQSILLFICFAIFISSFLFVSYYLSRCYLLFVSLLSLVCLIASRCLEVTGADGVMSSEGLLGNPKMFSEEGDRLFRDDFARSQLQTADDFLRILQSHTLPRPLFQVVRSHLFKILYKFSDAPNNIELRGQLANGNFEEMKDVVLKIHEKMSKIDYNTELGEELGLIGKTHWYFRHRDEKAFNRIMSIPRKKRSPVDLGSTAFTHGIVPKKETAEDVTAKIALLKSKLTERKEKALQEVSGTSAGETAGKTNYASFMSKL